MKHKKSKTVVYLLIVIITFFLFISNSRIMGHSVCEFSENFEGLFKGCLKTAQELQKDLDQKQIDYKNIEEKYLTLSRNTANNICCKMKVKNPSINFYEVQNNQIICLEGGTKSLDC